MNNLNFDMVDIHKMMEYKIVSVDYTLRLFGLTYSDLYNLKKKDGVIKFKDKWEK